MNFKDMLQKISQLSEATKETEKGRVHKAEPGGYGRKFDTDEEGDEKKDEKKKAEPAAKRGRGRPKKGADDTGEVKKYDWSAFGAKKDVKLPKWDKSKTTKHSLKEYFEEALTPGQKPIPVVGKQGDTQSTGAGFLNIDDTSPAGQAISNALGDLVQQKKAQIVMPTAQQTSKPGQPAQAGATGQAPTGQQPMSEKWGTETKVSPSEKGKYSGKSKAELLKSYNALKNSGPHKKGSPEFGKMRELAFAIRAKGDWGKVAEADMPVHDGDLGAGLGAGRDQGVMEGKKPDFLDLDKDGNKKESMKKAASDAKKDKKKVDEGMEHRLKSARHAGKAHALAKEGYNCRYDDMEEARAYHDGYKEGLDECYGQMPVQGMVGEEGLPPATVGGMADQAEELNELSPEVLGRYKTVASTARSGTSGALSGQMKYGGKLNPHDVKDFDNRTKGLARLDTRNVGAPGGSGAGPIFKKDAVYDSTVDEMAFESWDKQLTSLLENKEVSEGMTVSISKGQQGAPDSVSVSAQDAEADQLLGLIKQAGLGLFGGEEHNGYGAPEGEAPQHGGVDVVGDHDGMMALIKKATGAKEPASDYEDEESHEEHEEVCGECGMAECECGDNQEMVDEVESEDQMTYQMAEDSPEEAGEEEEQETTADEDDESAEDEAAAQYDDSQEVTESVKLDEWANEAGKRGTDAQFEADIDFMTKVISGGLNKQKSTGQTTVPIIAGQKDRTRSHNTTDINESVNDWKKLAGLK